MGSKMDLEKIREHFPRGNVLPRDYFFSFLEWTMFYGRTNSILKRKFSINRYLVHPKSVVKNDPRDYPRLFSGTKLVFRKLLFCISSRNASLVRISIDFDIRIQSKIVKRLQIERITHRTGVKSVFLA